MLVVPCPCGAKLRVKDEVAGHRVKCPKCNSVVRAPKTEDGAARGDLRVAPAKPSTSAKPLTQPESESIAPLDLLQQLSAGEPVVEETPRMVIPAAPTMELSYARDPAPMRAQLSRSSSLHDAVSGPRRGFWLDVAHAFVYPVASSGNLISLIIILIIAAGRFFVGFAPFFGTFGVIIIYGWLASVYLNIVRETASGEDDMPGIRIEAGPWEDIIKPAFTYLATFFFAEAPALTYYLLVWKGWLTPDRTLLMIWTGFGLFMWPFLMLLFALGEVRIVFKPHLIFLTLAKTILPYLCVWLALFIAAAPTILGMAAPILLQFGINPNFWVPSWWQSIGLVVFLEVLEVYLMLVSMRLIGLYYLHFKKRFAFELE